MRPPSAGGVWRPTKMFLGGRLRSGNSGRFLVDDRQRRPAPASSRPGRAKRQRGFGRPSSSRPPCRARWTAGQDLHQTSDLPAAVLTEAVRAPSPGWSTTEPATSARTRSRNSWWASSRTKSRFGEARGTAYHLWPTQGRSDCENLFHVPPETLENPPLMGVKDSFPSCSINDSPGTRDPAEFANS